MQQEQMRLYGEFVEALPIAETFHEAPAQHIAGMSRIEGKDRNCIKKFTLVRAGAAARIAGWRCRRGRRLALRGGENRNRAGTDPGTPGIRGPHAHQKRPDSPDTGGCQRDGEFRG